MTIIDLPASVLSAAVAAAVVCALALVLFASDLFDSLRPERRADIAVLRELAKWHEGLPTNAAARELVRREYIGDEQ